MCAQGPYMQKRTKKKLDSHIEIRIQISKMIIRDYIIRADIAHWGIMKDWKERELRVTVRDFRRGSDKKPFMIEVRPEQWACAASLMAVKYPIIFAELVNGEGDSFTGDLLIQLAAFGKQRYA